MLDFGLSPDDAVAAPRLWVNAANGTIGWNADLPSASIAAVRSLGQRLNASAAANTAFGSAESIGVDTATFALTPVTDARRSGPDGAVGVVQP